MKTLNVDFFLKKSKVICLYSSQYPITLPASLCERYRESIDKNSLPVPRYGTVQEALNHPDGLAVLGVWLTESWSDPESISGLLAAR